MAPRRPRTSCQSVVQPPTADLSALIQPNRHHVYAFGTEECENTIARSLVFASKEKWVARLTSELGPRYVRVASQTLAAIHIIVFAHEALMPIVSDIQTGVVATGIANTVGNKGGCAVGFNIGKTALLFVNCHLAAHQSEVAKRNQDLRRIELSMPLVPTGYGTEAKILLNGQQQQFGAASSSSALSASRRPAAAASSAAMEDDDDIDTDDEEEQDVPEPTSGSQPLKSSHSNSISGSRSTAGSAASTSAHVHDTGGGRVPSFSSDAAASSSALAASSAAAEVSGPAAQQLATGTSSKRSKSHGRSASVDPSLRASGARRVHSRDATSVGVDGIGNNGQASHRVPDRVSDRYDRVVWMGDLNYRINGTREFVDAALKANNHSALLQSDQCGIEMREGNIFDRFSEGPLHFRPTYKFDKNSDTYDSGPKMRIPAWTDRILFKYREEQQPGDSGNLSGGAAASSDAAPAADGQDDPPMRVLRYASIDSIKTSDHRPVVAVFDCKLRGGHVRGRRSSLGSSAGSAVGTLATAAATPIQPTSLPAPSNYVAMASGAPAASSVAQLQQAVAATSKPSVTVTSAVDSMPVVPAMSAITGISPSGVSPNEFKPVPLQQQPERLLPRTQSRFADSLRMQTGPESAEASSVADTGISIKPPLVITTSLFDGHAIVDIRTRLASDSDLLPGATPAVVSMDMMSAGSVGSRSHGSITTGFAGYVSAASSYFNSPESEATPQGAIGSPQEPHFRPSVANPKAAAARQGGHATYSGIESNNGRSSNGNNSRASSLSGSAISYAATTPGSAAANAASNSNSGGKPPARPALQHADSLAYSVDTRASRGSQRSHRSSIGGGGGGSNNTGALSQSTASAGTAGLSGVSAGFGGTPGGAHVTTGFGGLPPMHHHPHCSPSCLSSSQHGGSGLSDASHPHHAAYLSPSAESAFSEQDRTMSFAITANSVTSGSADDGGGGSTPYARNQRGITSAQYQQYQASQSVIVVSSQPNSPAAAAVDAAVQRLSAASGPATAAIQPSASKSAPRAHDHAGTAGGTAAGEASRVEQALAASTSASMSIPATSQGPAAGSQTQSPVLVATAAVDAKSEPSTATTGTSSSVSVINRNSSGNTSGGSTRSKPPKGLAASATVVPVMLDAKGNVIVAGSLNSASGGGSGRGKGGSACVVQ